MNQKKIGVVLSYIGQFINILIGLIYTPIMLRLLGQSEYGLYQLVYSVVSYLGLLNLGFASSYMRYYSKEKAKKDENGIAEINGMFMVIFVVLACICLLCGGALVINIESIFGSGLTRSEYTIARKLMVLMVINLALTFPNGLFSSILSSQEKFIFQRIVILLQTILNPLLAFPLLIAGYGSVGMVLVTTFLTLFAFISNVYYCIKKLNTKFSFENLNFYILKDMWKFTFFIFLNQIVDQINWSVDKFLLGRLVGTIPVAVYGVGSQINTLYLQFSTSVSTVFVPKVNRIVAETDDNLALTNLFIKVGRIQFIILSLILTGFIFFGKPFINFWVGDKYIESYIITLLLIVPVTVPLIQNLGIEIQRAKNMHKSRSVVYFFIAIANIFVSIPLIKLHGPTGAAIGTSISLIVGNVIFMNWYYSKRIGLDIRLFWKSIFRFIPAFIIPTIVGLIVMKIDYNNIYKLGLSIVIYTIIYLVSFYFLGMDKSEKELIFSKLRIKKEI